MTGKRLFIHSRRLLPGLALMLATTFLLISNLPERLDLVLYDSLLRFQYRAPSEEVVIVTIDEPSLDQLGRWPWSRRVHAVLLDILTEHGVRSVGFDILFAEPELDDPDADILFSQAMARNGRVVLAIAPGHGTPGRLITEILPIPLFADNAAALGHVDFELDVDGVTRSVYLRAGLGNPHWPAFSLALAELVKPDLDTEGLAVRNQAGEDSARKSGWVRSDLILTPFSGPIGHFREISYIDVLSGNVPQEVLQDRIVLIGSTASGLGDALATPVSWDHRRMPGVEMNAHVLNAILTDSQILPLSPRIRLLLNLGFMAALYLAFLLLPSRFSLLVLVVGAGTVILTTIILLVGLQRWFPPVILLLVQGLSYPLWSWYQLQTASRAIKQLEHRIRHQARHDPVTRLPNREMLQESLQRFVTRAQIRNCSLGLLIISLDRFRQINNSLGLKGGDLLLHGVAERLRKVVRDDDIVARISGDEFAILMADLQGESPVIDMAGRLAVIFHQPIEINGQQFFLSPSIGANLYPHGGADSDSLLHNTYTAMQKAKSDKTKDFWVYDTGIRTEILAQSNLENTMRFALQHNEFELFYQPQVIADSGRVIGVEALIRWRHGERGLIQPSEFIPLAEANGLIVPIGRWVLEEACREAQQWRRDGMAEISVAVNLSAVQFNHPNLVESVAEILKGSGLPAHLLELELTETALMQDMHSAARTLKDLKALGVQLAIDDFGTGYSSLSYLKSFPMDRIKIDRSFIYELDANSETAEITLAIIDMAHRLKLDVIAEGVETPDQRAFLSHHHCDQLQGFLFGRPVPAAELTEILKSGADLRLSTQEV
ncbi:MAG: EAL domain-containing protein [Gammaproteobacteria bacterium]|nr:EAL domain-containing protein [Gammaproteobacteria bacterium]